MKKVIAILSLSVLMLPVFALNAGVTTSDVLKDYPGQVSAQAKEQLAQVVNSLNEVVNALEHGYKLTGPEDVNQYGTMIRERLEKDYAALFAEDEKLASYVYLTMIRPVSQDIECQVNETFFEKKLERKELSKAELLSIGPKFQATVVPAFKRVGTAKQVIESLGDQDDMICQYIMTTLADPLKKMPIEEATIEAAVYGKTIKVHDIPLAEYIKQQALRLNWLNDTLDEFESFGKFIEESVSKVENN